ncbi:hypothetical protein SAZ11_59000 [Streptomyces sp. FXJ1.4098]|nr:hypothetical protein [Streptomyces sp. FXJ1.4098]
MRPYGLPLRDLDSIRTWEDLADPDRARRMGQAMNARLGRGDTAVNLAATSLAVNAWLYDHDDRHRDWALDYLTAWQHRAQTHGGFLPDNVGPSGEVGEDHGGRWYGGLYGWTWPHGLYSVGNAAVIAAVNSVLLTGTTDLLALGRGPFDEVLAHAVRGAVTDTEMSTSDRWLAELGEDADRPTLLVPTGTTTAAGSTTSRPRSPFPCGYGTPRWPTRITTACDASARCAATTGVRSAPSATRRRAATKPPGWPT